MGNAVNIDNSRVNVGCFYFTFYKSHNLKRSGMSLINSQSGLVPALLYGMFEPFDVQGLL